MRCSRVIAFCALLPLIVFAELEEDEIEMVQIEAVVSSLNDSPLYPLEDSYEPPLGEATALVQIFQPKEYAGKELLIFERKSDIQVEGRMLQEGSVRNLSQIDFSG
jgi:hypothetical protein